MGGWFLDRSVHKIKKLATPSRKADSISEMLCSVFVFCILKNGQVMSKLKGARRYDLYSKSVA